MGRPPKDELSKRSKSLRLRLTAAEHAWLKVMSEEKNISLRELLWRAFQNDVRQMPEDDFSEMSGKVAQEVKAASRHG